MTNTMIPTRRYRDSPRAIDFLMPPQEQDYGGELYICRDPEGNVWKFGSYDPWAS